MLVFVMCVYLFIFFVLYNLPTSQKSSNETESAVPDWLVHITFWWQHTVRQESKVQQRIKYSRNVRKTINDKGLRFSTENLHNKTENRENRGYKL